MQRRTDDTKGRGRTAPALSGHRPVNHQESRQPLDKSAQRPRNNPPRKAERRNGRYEPDSRCPHLATLERILGRVIRVIEDHRALRAV